MKKPSKKDTILLSISATILVAIAVFLIVFWDTAYAILEKLLNGIDLVQDYIRSFGIVGIIVMMIIIIVLFFFPFISSMPIQIACGIGYGIWLGGLIVLTSLFIATQLLFLFRQNLRVFSSQKQIKKRQELEKLIRESDRNVYFAIAIAYLLPAVPFLVISNLAASCLKYWKYTLVTIAGMIPDILVTIFLGEKLLSTSPVASVITLIAVIIVITLSIIFNDKLVYLAFAPRKKKNKPTDNVTAEIPSENTPAVEDNTLENSQPVGEEQTHKDNPPKE